MNGIAGVVTIAANLLLMFYIGFGGLGSLSLAGAAGAYFLPVFLWLYVLMGWLDRYTRTWSLIGISVPWGVIALIVGPQFNHDPSGVSLVFGSIILLWIMRIPGELIATSVFGRKD